MLRPRMFILSTGETGEPSKEIGKLEGCLLYTSDAADERSSVDLGGRRIIKKKKKIIFFFFKQKTAYEMIRSLVGSEMCIRDSVYIVDRRDGRTVERDRKVRG